MSDSGEWKIGYEDYKHQEKIEAEYKSDTQLSKRWLDFERDVTANPYRHPKHKRIARLKDSRFPKGTYRYRNEPIRVVYFPEGKKKIVYPLAVGTATDIPYKKRSFKK
jgi:mRNA-degrading endonuclease RelE of RelBE toxin-antitoxin system